VKLFVGPRARTWKLRLLLLNLGLFPGVASNAPPMSGERFGLS
jgi:hypothetical protein